MVLLSTRIAKNKKIPWRIVEGEAILVDVSGASIIHLNEVGAEIWNVIDGKNSIADIVKHISNTFDVDEKTAQNDTIEFIKQLFEKGVIEDIS
jgi:hypothetical protein